MTAKRKTVPGAKASLKISYASCTMLVSEPGFVCVLCGKPLEPGVVHQCGTDPDPTTAHLVGAIRTGLKR
jgi:hypothetical protein